MKKIALSGELGKGKFVLVDDEDFEKLNKYKWHFGTGYARRLSKGSHSTRKVIWMHRVIMNTPSNMVIDHIDGEGLNNQKYNLRNCLPKENARNTRIASNNTSGYKGVYRFHKSWRAVIFLNGKMIHLKMCSTPLEGAKIYNEAAIKYHGEFASLNKI